MKTKAAEKDKVRKIIEGTSLRKVLQYREKLKAQIKSLTQGIREPGSEPDNDEILLHSLTRNIMFGKLIELSEELSSLKDEAFRELKRQSKEDLKKSNIRHTTKDEKFALYKKITFEMARVKSTGEKKTKQKICSDIIGITPHSPNPNSPLVAYNNFKRRYRDIYALDKAEAEVLYPPK